MVQGGAGAGLELWGAEWGALARVPSFPEFPVPRRRLHTQHGCSQDYFPSRGVFHRAHEGINA